MSDSRNPQIFITKLPPEITERDLDREFRQFGYIKELHLKRSYAFITFDTPEAASDAIKKKDGDELKGHRIVVQHARGKRHFPHHRSRSSSSSQYSSVSSYDHHKKFTRRTGPQSDDICYNCGKKGHWANECREPVKPEYLLQYKFSRGRYFKDEGRCYYCGERGHFERECPRKNYGRSSRNFKRRSHRYSSHSSRSRSRSHSQRRRDRRDRRKYSSSEESKSSGSSSSHSPSKSRSQSRSRSSKSKNESSKSHSKSSRRSNNSTNIKNINSSIIGKDELKEEGNNNNIQPVLPSSSTNANEINN